MELTHSQDVVHRDLKPENILLNQDMVVKICDYGFAVDLSAQQGNHGLRDLCGTPVYMAPEMLQASMFEDAEGYGKEVDVWACGVILFLMLSGVPPFWHRKQMVMIRAIMEGKFSFSAPEWSDVSDLAKDLVTKLLTLDPSKRLTPSQGLQHPFLSIGTVTEQPFEARKKFIVAIVAVRFVVRMNARGKGSKSTTFSHGDDPKIKKHAPTN
jgi:phosphorylase kinase gamma subunit